MISVRIYYTTMGRHVHCRVFTAQASPDGSQSLLGVHVGSLTFSVEEFSSVQALLSAAEWIHETPDQGDVLPDVPTAPTLTRLHRASLEKDGDPI
jgi:hypothetical protein